MCAILGEVNTKQNLDWLERHITHALSRGKDLSGYRSEKIDLYHTRLATNNSTDTYPIQFEGARFAMNGIVSEATYKKLQKQMGSPLHGYTVDSAYLLQLYLNSKDWSVLDSDNFVFAFWLSYNGSIFIGNKDFPLFYKREGDGFRFSSFRDEDLIPAKNSVYEYRDNTLRRIYSFKELVYA